MKRLVFASLEPWDQIWRRNQFVCRELLAREPDLQILWVNPPRDRGLLSSAGLAALFCAARGNAAGIHADKQYDRLFWMQPTKVLPNVIGWRLNNWLARQELETAMRTLGWRDDYVFWINNQSMRNCLPRHKPAKIVYDITDDWTQSSLPPHRKRRVVQDDAWLLENADQVIVCSPALYESKKGQARNLALVQNGVDSQRYAPDRLRSLALPADMQALKKPIAGYTGTLHSDRLDLDLVAAVAQALPAVQFVFIGPDCLLPAEREEIIRQPNCHILGPRPYDDLPNYIAAFDVCLAPHKVNAFTDSLDPLKLYEYMATGKPVVATACAGFRSVPELVDLAADAQSFAAAVSRACAGDGLEEARVNWAKSRSWSGRVAEIQRLLGWT